MFRSTLSAVCRPLTALIALAAMTALTGCEIGESCPAIYVPDVLAIELDDEPMGDETWLIAIVDDGEPYCVLALTGDRLAPFHGCDDWSPWLGQSEPGTIRIEMPDFTPEQVTVLLTIDGVEAGAVEGAPTYQTVEDEAMCAVTQQGEITLTVER